MKKLSIFLMAVLALGMSSCNDEVTGTVQENPKPGQVMQLDGLEVEPCTEIATAVNLNDYTAEGEDLIPVLKIVRLEDFPANYALEGVMQYAKDENFEKFVEVPLVWNEAGDILFAASGEWENMHIELFSKNPRTTDAWVRVELFAVNGSSVVRIADADGNLVYDEHKIQLTPFPAARVIEEHYYLTGDLGTEIAANNPLDVYNPPTFSVVFDIVAGMQLKVKSESGIVYGAGTGEDAGKLIENGGEYLELPSESMYMLTINMEELTYEFSLAVPYLYSYQSSPTSGTQLSTPDHIKYYGFIGFREKQEYFKLADAKVAKPKMIWGADGMDYSGEIPMSGKISVQGSSAANIVVPHAGCYWTTINLSENTYELVEVTQWGVVGSMTGWAEGADIVMTPNTKNSTYKASVALTNGAEFKFRCNGSWDLQVGTTPGSPTVYTALEAKIPGEEDPGNILWEGADGTYTVTLNLSVFPYTVTIE